MGGVAVNKEFDGHFQLCSAAVHIQRQLIHIVDKLRQRRLSGVGGCSRGRLAAAEAADSQAYHDEQSK